MGGKIATLSFLMHSFQKGWCENSWSSGFALIDQRNACFHIPDGQKPEDGKIILFYDYNRTTNQNSFITSFTDRYTNKWLWQKHNKNL